MASTEKQREDQVQLLFDKAIDAIEEEHGLWGLDHALLLLERRILCSIQELEEELDEVEKGIP